MIQLLKKYRYYLKGKSLFILLGIITLFPFLVLSFFNNPATDDFYYSYYVRHYSIYEAPFWMYNHVGGRYFANTILCFSPVYFESMYWYKIVPILLLLLFLFSCYHFISSVLKTSSFRKKLAVVGLLASLYLFQLPDACSAFYWMPGSITNQLPISLNLLAFSFLIQFYNSRKNQNILFSVLFFIFALGCNEMTVIFTLILLYFTVFYKIIVLRKVDLTLLFITLLTTLFSAVEFLAPGNIERAKAIPVTHEFLYSLTHSFISSINYFFKWLPFILVCCLFFVETMYKKIAMTTNKSVFIHPILAFALLFSMLFFGFFPGFWVNHDILPDRAINTIYFYFIISAIYLFVCTVYYLKEHHNFFIKLTNSTTYVLGSIILLFMFSNSPIYKAYYDLANGKAYHYNQEMVHRIHLIKNTTDKTVTVPALIHQPETIFKPIIMGLTTDKNDWKNKETSDYFNKEIVVQPTDSVFTE